MTTDPSSPALLTDDQLDRAFDSAGMTDATRTALLYERVRRLARPAQARAWVQWATLLFSFLAAVLAAVAAWPVVSDIGEKEWYDWFKD